MSSTRLISVTVALCASFWSVAGAGDGPGFAELLEGTEPLTGFLDLHVDRDAGRVWMEVPPADRRGVALRCLYVDSLLTGLGSNPVGLDRGRLGETRVVELRRIGGRVLIEAPNLRYRALSSVDDERSAARQSFATSVLWAGPIAARHDDGRALVDLTGFIVRDAHGVARRLAAAGQGRFSLDPERSAVDASAIRVFPANVELEALLTFAGDEPGPLIAGVAPLDDSVTLVQHHSFVELPAEGYLPREHDPRAGSFAIEFADYAAGLTEPLTRRWIVRHRLEKTDPAAARSPVRRPIVYHVDRGAPEPVRTALVEGASWWADAFEAAGFLDAFRIELMPADAHPLDVRYNVIQWVHRSTRGWSYGGGVVDPRTGERIKGHVTLGSLRVRQDRLLFEGLLGADGSGSGAQDDPVELALARIRQLAAHEVGHALGFDHNFAASTYDGRASVMDYPAPLVRAVGDRLDVSDAYAVGVGSWDRHAVRWAYSQFPPAADDAAELERIVRDGLERGLLFLGDADARPDGAAHPAASLWDNGADPVAELERVLRVRAIALERFGADRVASGRPLAHLQEVLATVYLGHRYQLKAAAKVLGGVEYGYALRGDGQSPARPVDGAEQRRALRGLLAALEPRRLDLSESTLGLLLPRPSGASPGRELFRTRSAPAFDALGAAATAADLVVAELLQPARGARLVDFHRRDERLPSLEEVLGELRAAAFGPVSDEPRLAAIAGAVQHVVVAGLTRLATDDAAAPWVRSRAEDELRALGRLLSGGVAGVPRARAAALVAEIGRVLERTVPPAPAPEPAPAPPPGSPIGGRDDGCDWSEHAL